MRGIESRVAIISGGATSIGAEIVRVFMEAGASVVIADIDVSEGSRLAGELGDAAIFAPTDLSSDDQIQACVSAAVAQFDRIDFVVNAAALYQDHGAGSSRADWARAFDVNVTGPVMLACAARPHLAATRGAVVNIGSISAKVAQAGRWTYPASKAALAQATRNLALDFAEDSIRVNSVSPGWTWSGGMEKMGLTREAVDRIAAPFHLPGRAGDRQEVAEAVLFLCSDHARFISGTDLAVDGGYTALGPEGRPSAFAALAAATREIKK